MKPILRRLRRVRRIVDMVGGGGGGDMERRAGGAGEEVLEMVQMIASSFAEVALRPIRLSVVVCLCCLHP